MNSRKELNQVRFRRTRRNAMHLKGASSRPRLAVFRSNKSFSAQLIDDTKGHTLASVSMKELGKAKQTKSEQAAALGEAMAKKATAAGVKAAVLDRRGYAYHGRVKAFTEAARKGGLQI